MEMAMYSKDDAKIRILKLFAAWAKDKGYSPEKRVSGSEAMDFFQFVSTHHSDALNYRTKITDKWQEVHAWLGRAGYSE
jgi:hypothetical protein